MKLKKKKSSLPQMANRLSDFAGKIRTFRDVDDPVALQRRLRDSWKRGWEK